MNYPLLDTIKDPLSLKHLSLIELEEIAKEIREKIIDVISCTGGHLSSNLGIVELTLALHKSFSSPNDKFIFDTGHQSYAHKLLTGRNLSFSSIRQFKGLAGFPNPEESAHDHFLTGHAGTALSLALGMAKNRDLTKREEHIIPIIGDASLTCGLTLEALNNISENLERFIVILNDNKMAISPNVGNIQNVLNAHTENKSSLGKISRLLLKESEATSLSPASFFENFNLNYVGPIDGHNIAKLLEALESAKDQKRPVVLHVLTSKGKGLFAAMNQPAAYHGVRPFDKTSGQFLPSASNNPTFPKIFGDAIVQMAEKDPSVLAITAATAEGSHLNNFREKFPDRCLDVGIAEGHAVTFAGGLAYGGKMKVIVSIYSSFLQRAFDNLFHDVCLQKLPVLFAIDRGGISGPDGATHHGIYDIGFLNAMPNMIIAQPRNGRVLRELLQSAFSWEQPTAIRYPNSCTDDCAPTQKRELGSAEILNRGQDLLIIALGNMCSLALEVKEKLAQANINPTILDPIFLKPLDSDLLYDLLLTHKFVVTLEEHALSLGLATIFNSFTIRNGLTNVQILNLGIPDTFLPHGSNEDLLGNLGLEAKQIAKKIIDHFSLKEVTAHDCRSLSS